MIRGFARLVLATLALDELRLAHARHARRSDLYAVAQAQARDLQRPFVVVGDPDAGAHTRLLRAYDCGDLCVDLQGCPACPTAVRADLTAGPTPGVADDSAVVFVGCTLEYVEDFEPAYRECLRMAGDPARLHVVAVDGLTATLYPGARWRLVALPDGGWTARPVTPGDKGATLLGLGALAYLARPVSAPKDRRQRRAR